MGHDALGYRWCLRECILSLTGRPGHVSRLLGVPCALGCLADGLLATVLPYNTSCCGQCPLRWRVGSLGILGLLIVIRLACFFHWVFIGVSVRLCML